MIAATASFASQGSAFHGKTELQFYVQVFTVVI